MEHRWELDGDLLDHRLLPSNLDLLWRIGLREPIVDVSRGSRLADVDEHVVEDEVLVVFGRRLLLIRVAKRLTSLAEEESEGRTRRDR
jgi:hypothetical protein